MTGKEAILTSVAGFFDAFSVTIPVWTTDEVVVSGDLAVHRYSNVAILTPKAGGDPVELDRKNMDVLRKQPDGRWLVSRHMFNLNQ